MRYSIRAHRTLILSLAAVAVMCTAAVWPQNFPSKPVHYVVPFGAGASPDIVARLLADRLTRLWGQQVVVENRVGVAGVMGSAYVAKAPADGHTLLQCNIASNAIAMSLFAKMPYDQVRDLAAVTRIGVMPNVIIVHPSVPIRSLKGLIAYAAAHPGKLSYASGLVGTSPQLSMELVKLMTKIDIVNIPYKIGAQGINDNIAGQIPVGVFNLPAMVGPVQSGRLRGLAVTTTTRAPQLPAVPTVDESGLRGYDVSSWYGVCAAAGTPAAVLDKLNADINLVLGMPEVRQRLDDLLMIGPPTSREDFDQFIRMEIAKWAKVIREAGIQQQ